MKKLLLILTLLVGIVEAGQRYEVVTEQPMTCGEKRKALAHYNYLARFGKQELVWDYRTNSFQLERTNRYAADQRPYLRIRNMTGRTLNSGYVKSKYIPRMEDEMYIPNKSIHRHADIVEIRDSEKVNHLLKCGSYDIINRGSYFEIYNKF
jgi:hypothetical protein